MKIFGLEGSKAFAHHVCRNLGMQLSQHTERQFDDGETFIKSNENIRGEDVYIIESLFSDEKRNIGQKFSTLLFFMGSLVDASARSINLVCPYLAFSRQDRKTESRAGIYTKYAAIHFEAAQATRLVTMDVHNLSALNNAFRIPTDNLEAKNLIIDYLVGGVDRDGIPIENHIDDPLLESDIKERLVIVSPDSGGVGRCKRFRNTLERRLGLQNQINVVHLDKERQGSSVKGNVIVGLKEGQQAIIYDDMIGTATTMKVCHEVIKKQGGELFAACATHGLFVGQAEEKLADFERIIVSDSIRPFRLTPAFRRDKVHVISTTHLIAQAIHETETKGSISKLLTYHHNGEDD